MAHMKYRQSLHVFIDLSSSNIYVIRQYDNIFFSPFITPNLPYCHPTGEIITISSTYKWVTLSVAFADQPWFSHPQNHDQWQIETGLFIRGLLSSQTIELTPPTKRPSVTFVIVLPVLLSSLRDFISHLPPIYCLSVFYVHSWQSVRRGHEREAKPTKPFVYHRYLCYINHYIYRCCNDLCNELWAHIQWTLSLPRTEARTITCCVQAVRPRTSGDCHVLVKLQCHMICIVSCSTTS